MIYLLICAIANIYAKPFGFLKFIIILGFIFSLIVGLAILGWILE